MRRLAAPVLAAAYAGLIFYLSSRSTAPVPLPGIDGLDKVLHALEYAWLGLLVTWTLGTYGSTPRRALILGPIVCSLYGAGDELHQSLVPGRECDAVDWLADTSGGALGAAAWLLWSRRARRPPLTEEGR